MAAQQNGEQLSGSTALRQYLAKTCSRLDTQSGIDEHKLRKNVIPQIVESIIRLSKGAPAEVKEEIQQILANHGMLPDCTADMATLGEALRHIDKAISVQSGTTILPHQEIATCCSMDSMESTPGDRTFKHVFTPKHPGGIEDYYELEKVLGEGSFGMIYSARAKAESSPFHIEVETSTDVCRPLRAVKTVSSSVAPKRFEAEVKVQQQLDHPNIVKLYEVFKDKLKYYLVLELCTGGELFDRVVEAGGTFCESACATYMRQLLNAVNYLHSNNVAHRDLKLENLLLYSKAADSLLKVVDFGCARTFAPSEAMTTSLGTILYVAPEVVKKSYNEKCDVWSCGVIMFVLLCGETPFRGIGEQDTLRNVMSGNFEYPGDEDDPSDPAQDMINSMLTVEAETRPTAEALLDHAWLKGNVSQEQGKPLPKDLVSRLRSFRMVSQFKKIALEIAAQAITDEDIMEMQKTFIALDTCQNGSLTHAEVATGLTSHGIKLPADLVDIIASVDTDKSGLIDYTEFIASTLTRKQYLREEVLWSIFRTFDLDGDGRIQRDEFAQVVSMSDDAAITQAFDDADLNGDHEIDFSEFCKVMRSKNASC